ncbi:MAG TPA: sugar transferase [Flavobacteriales bacterium]|nr:sugar transferase [Flavobacteriales bacterium]
MPKRLFDFSLSLFGLIILLPALFIISIGVVLTSKGGVLFSHRRVGKNEVDFYIYKFRTMHANTDETSELTLGNLDPRITRFGRFLRKYKLDELPQLINVLIGDMSFVGPRPEVRKYVDNYTEEQLALLSVRPGITDYASIEYADEGEILGKASDPEKEYLEVVLPRKLELGLKYVNERSFFTDISIILRTLGRLLA